MPTAALADVHGNLHALDAVLADPRLAEADRIVVLGDVVTGTFPAEALDRLTALPGRVSFLRGNADRLALDDPGDWYGWVRERLGPERMATVRSWPLTFALDVEGLGPVRCCHAVPSDDVTCTEAAPSEPPDRTTSTVTEPAPSVTSVGPAVVRATVPGEGPSSISNHVAGSVTRLPVGLESTTPTASWPSPSTPSLAIGTEMHFGVTSLSSHDSVPVVVV